jgi:Protein of unknown function (DUF2795)
VNTQRAAEIQAVLEGVRLPATRADLVAYARGQDPDVVADLEGLPDEEFRSLDDVGELLTLAPTAPATVRDLPRPESGKPPGGEDYLTPHPADTGRVRHDAPPENPPQKAIEHQSALQKQQQAEQSG